MFRFLHAADLHLDSPMVGLSSRDGEVVEGILGASRRAFEKLIDVAISEEVAMVVISGDVYDRDWKGYETGLFFRKGMIRLREAGIRVFLISGNHDAASLISRKLSLPDNVTAFSSRAPESHELNNLPIAIHGMSFPDRAVEENLVPRYPEPVAGRFNLGILHTSLAGDAGHDTYAPCSVIDLVNKGYDYWALGHIHQPQVIHEDPWIVYSGNIQGRSVKECGERGCRIVTVSDSGSVAECRWQPLDVARWTVIEIDVTDLTSIEALAAAAKQRLAEESDAIGDRILAARLRFVGATDLHGALQSRPDRLEAEVQASVDELDGDRIWIERICSDTSTRISLEKLAERDALTRMVVESVQGNSGTREFPQEITTMLGVLPPDVRQILEAEMSDPHRESLSNSVAQILLHRLTTKGGAE